MAAPLTVKIGLALLVIGFILFIIGFGTSHWYEKEYETRVSRLRAGRRYSVRVQVQSNFGLWRHCWGTSTPGVDESETEFCRYFLDGPDSVSDMSAKLAGELRATQFFETVALILMVPSFLFLILGACVESCKNRKIMPILSGVCILAAAGCVFLGAIIFGTWEGTEDHLSWSFALAVVGGVFFAFAGIVIIVGVVLKK